ncbi:sensor histidine kinase [bacterium]|nr:sensor histidine kinase [bacterium]
MAKNNDRQDLALLRGKRKAETAEKNLSKQKAGQTGGNEPKTLQSRLRSAESSPVSHQALESEMKNVLSSLWSFKEVLIEFKDMLHKDCNKSLNELTKQFEEMTRAIDVSHENLRLKDEPEDKIKSVKGIGLELSGAIEHISQSASSNEAYIEIASKISPLINTYSDVIEKVSLMESNLETYFRSQKTSEERKEHAKSQSILPGASAIIRSQELERQRIAREIHDGPAQAIANVIFRLDIVQKIMEQRPEAIEDEMSKVKKIAQGALNEIRHFIFDLRPMTLQDLGLTATLRKIVQRSPEKYNTKVELMIEGEERELNAEVDLAIFRIAQESLNNIKKHAKASNAWIQLKYLDAKVVLIVEDNGVGFDMKRKKEQSQKEYNSFGLLGMQERADDIAGSLQITSQPMRGTKVIFTVPIQQD